MAGSPIAQVVVEEDVPGTDPTQIAFEVGVQTPEGTARVELARLAYDDEMGMLMLMDCFGGMAVIPGALYPALVQGVLDLRGHCKAGKNVSESLQAMREKLTSIIPVNPSEELHAEGMT